MEKATSATTKINSSAMMSIVDTYVYVFVHAHVHVHRTCL